MGFGGLVALLGSAGMAAQYALSALSAFVVEDLALSRTQLGVLPTAMFGVATVASLTTGPALDRWGTRRVAVLTLLLSTAALLGAASARTFAWLVLSAGVAGVAVAAAKPVTSSLVAAHAPLRPGVYLGLKQAGAQLYAFATGASLPALALAAGWRTAMAASCLPGLAAAWLVPRLVPRSAPPRRDGPLPSLRRHDLRWLPVYALLMGAAQGALNRLPAALRPRGARHVTRRGGRSRRPHGPLGGLRPGGVGLCRWARGHQDAARDPGGHSVACTLLLLLAMELGPVALWIGATTYGVTAGAWATVAMLTWYRPPARTARATSPAT